MKNIAVIGAGASGLCSLRYILENGDKFNGVIFEQMDCVGGTWVYTESVGLDKYGVPIHTSMYKNLRTNLPKESMQFPYFNFKEHKQSYVPREVILEYLNDYANAYNLRGRIKLNHCVKEISPEGKKWNIIVKNLKENREEFYEFDAVIIGSGHNSCAVYPEIKGIETFKGTQIHSHDYRVPEKYKDQIVLVIGAGPSGLDIIDDISKTAKKIIWSHHSERIQGNIFPDVLKKPDVVSATGNTIEFKDGTTCEVESIIFCTGYRFSYPFLTESCGISTADNYVRPLYKHIININHPTMGFIGIPKLTPQFPLFDIQVRYFLKMLIIGLPTKETMFQDLNKFEKSKSDLKLAKKCYPVLYNDTEQYRKDLVKEAMINPVPEILMKMHDKAIDFVLTDFQNFRKNVFKVINENDFEIRELDE